ncbi:MAG: alpha/beta fold hydrolase [Alphaproteobacteria bacterium]|nr:alpha/beta fold hydrolase [Alphaproteobacteria bacterium]
MHLEIISRKPKVRVNAPESLKSKPKLVFVHGICVGAWIWDEFFLSYFADHGYEAHALSLRGHGDSEGKGGLLTWSLDDYADDLDRVVESLGGQVIVIGHSLGGAVVQNWLRVKNSRNKTKGAALLASIPPWGLAYSGTCMMLFYPQIFHEISRMLVMGTASTDKVVMRKALFSESASDAIFNRLWDQVCDESFVASSEVQGLRSFAPQPGMKRPAVFVGGAADDRFIPSAEVCRTAAYYGVEAVMVEDLAHLVMIDTNWEDMAKPLLSWIKEL